MSIWSSLGKIAKGVAGAIPVVGQAIDVAEGLSGLIKGDSGQKRLQASQAAMNAANIASQERINAANVASQEKINQQQLDFAQQINDAMRYDSKHAISDKKADLIRAGYSAADPSLQGFSAASLSSPNLQAPTQVAPHVESEFTPAMAEYGLSSLIGRRKLGAEVALMQAQAKSQNANATGQELDNVWKNVEHQVALQETYARIGDLVSSRKLKEQQAVNLVQSLDNLKKEGDILSQDLRVRISEANMKDFEDKHQAEQYFASMAQIMVGIQNVAQSTTESEMRVSLMSVQKQYEAEKVYWAKKGINLEDNGWASILLRMIDDKTPAEVVESVKEVAGQTLDELEGVIEETREEFEDDPVKGVVFGASAMLYAWSRARQKNKKNKKMPDRPDNYRDKKGNKKGDNKK